MRFLIVAPTKIRTILDTTKKLKLDIITIIGGGLVNNNIKSSDEFMEIL